MPYILPDGNYYDAGDWVADGSIACAVRPEGYVLKDNWRRNPTNGAVCWRKKTPSEVDAEAQAEEDNLSFNGMNSVIMNALLDHDNRLRRLEGRPEITLQQMIKNIRKL